jgi:hypothetical protein
MDAHSLNRQQRPARTGRPVRREPGRDAPAEQLLRLQQTCGKQAVLRHLAVQRQPAPQQQAMPHELMVIPFDHSPMSAPGETVLFHALFDQAPSADFQLVFSGAGGKFDGAATRTVAGLDSGNVPFVIDRAWNGSTPVTVRLELKRVADGSVVKPWTWTFSKKVHLPTTIAQDQGEGEFPLGQAYDYKLGPDLGNDGKIDYGHQTILETFDPPTANFTLAEIKPAWKRQNPGVTTDAQLVAKLFGGSGANGTFTVDADDKIHDQHDGMPDKADFEAALTTMKEIRVDIVQTYSVQPGTPLVRYRITRILKTDGSKKVKKEKL